MNKSTTDMIINAVFLAANVVLFLYFHQQISSWFFNSKGANTFSEITVAESMTYLQILLSYIMIWLIFLSFFILFTSGQGNALKRIGFIFELGAVLTKRIRRSVH